MRTLFFLIALSFLIQLSFSLKDEKIHATKEIVHDLKKLSSEFVSTLNSTYSFLTTCDCDMQAMKHLDQMLNELNPESVSSNDGNLLGRITKNIEVVAPKQGGKNCSRPARRLRKRAPMAVLHLENLQHWLRKC